MGTSLPEMACVLAAIAAVAVLTIFPGMAIADSDTMTETTIYTTVKLNDDGGAHVDQHVLVTDIAQEPIAVGSITLNLLKNDAIWSGLATPRNDYLNIQVVRQDGTPVEYVLDESGDNAQLQIFSQDLLMTGWNSQFIVSYDVDHMVSENLLTKEFGFSTDVSGTRMSEHQVMITLPEGSHIVYASPGASVNGESLSWSGPDAGNILIEYSGLPLPASPVQLQYLFWGGLVLISLAWCLKPKGLTWRRNDNNELANNGDSPVDPVPGAADGCDMVGDRVDGQ